MRSARSWFNPTLFKKNMTRFWPIWGLYLVLWLFMLPINLMLNNYASAAYFAQRTVIYSIFPIGLLLSVAFSLLAACAVWSYLYNSRSACLMHTLPIRREGLFLTNFLSGMTFLAGPNLAVFLLTLLAEGARGAVDVGALVMWLFSMTLMELAFFCFATFCAMFTGHILGLPAFYVILNGLAAGLVALLDLTLSSFVFGYTGIGGLWSAVEWLTPVWKLTDSLEVRYIAATDTYQFVGLGYILIYAFFGLILAALALAVYRRRDMERTGDVVTVTWMRPVFQYGVAFCCALAFGTLLFIIFSSTLPDTAWTLLVFMLLCGAAGYFIARMLLEKSFRVFRCWKGCIPFLAALVVLVCVMELDLTGFERRTPDEDEIASVRLWGISTRPYDEGSWIDIESRDPAIIHAVLETHQAIVENKNAIEKEASNWVASEMTSQAYPVQTSCRVGFYVTYFMKGGSTISREYPNTIPVSVQELSDPDSLAAQMNALINLPQIIEECYGLADESAEDLVALSLTGSAFEDAYDEMTGAYVNNRYEQSVAVDQEAWARVFDAVLADLEEGNIGRRYLMDDEERMNNCFVNDLQFTFYRGNKPDQVRTDNGSETVPTDATTIAPTAETITVTLQTTAKHTLAVLRELGVLEDPVRLVTQAQNGAAYNTVRSEYDGSWESIDLDDYVWTTLGG